MNDTNDIVVWYIRVYYFIFQIVSDMIAISLKYKRSETFRGEIKCLNSMKTKVN